MWSVRLVKIDDKLEHSLWAKELAPTLSHCVLPYTMSHLLLFLMLERNDIGLPSAVPLFFLPIHHTNICIR